MIEKVVEIVLNKFLQPRTRQQRADDDVKQRLVFLHESLVACHNAYLQYSSERSEMNLENWRKAVRDLAFVLDEVGLVLSSFSPEAFNYASEYFASEVPMPDDYNAGDEEAYELTRTVRRLELLRSGKPKKHDDDEFKEATTRLREFMKEHMTPGEVQQAQEAFRRETYWRHSF